MRVIAKQGDRRWLILTDEAQRLGRVVDLDQGVTYGEQSIDQIAGRGYWEEVAGSEAQAQELLAKTAERPMIGVSRGTEAYLRRQQQRAEHVE